MHVSSVQFNSLTAWVVGGRGWGGGWGWWGIQQRSFSGLFCGRLSWAVLAWAGTSALWLCPSSISSADHGITHPGALKDGFAEAVIVCDMPGPWQFLSLDICQNKFLWAYNAVDLHQITGLVLHIGDAEKFPQTLRLKSLVSFLRVKGDLAWPLATSLEDQGWRTASMPCMSRFCPKKQNKTKVKEHALSWWPTLHEGHLSICSSCTINEWK